MRVMAAIFALMFSLAACADEQAAAPAFKEGTHYVELDNPVRTKDPSKIEVTEVFWYGCGHCFQFEPIVHQWSEKLPADVAFVRSPAMWNGAMEVHAHAFYVAKALGILDEVHQPLFNALNLERKRLANVDELADFFAQYGVDKETFEKTYKSFGVTSQVKQADARARSYKITGTPEVVVNGKYRISARMAGGQKQMLDVADFLVAKIRDEQG
ncbi:thiol:disulfide interchange protein DsbA/DsbL [Pseudomaricurvus albidus]|uniref:thiol:disulfide interchange protein DsbA/DsbL n=1 Tax=Pseudomaricurvus albidus TaxID=2842452 RepID=UPI001F1F5158|nr:thiol:disulfide interchange protein DsbA/DsbL [Aestuariicella albida]